MRADTTTAATRGKSGWGSDETMRIATWNINGVRARLDTALSWLKDATPDIVCLQETKIEDGSFPKDAFEDLGYNVATHGQKGFNGVALLSKLPFDETKSGLAGDDGLKRTFDLDGRDAVLLLDLL